MSAGRSTPFAAAHINTISQPTDSRPGNLRFGVLYRVLLYDMLKILHFVQDDRHSGVVILSGAKDLYASIRDHPCEMRTVPISHTIN